MTKKSWLSCLVLFSMTQYGAAAEAVERTWERMAEWTIHSEKAYANPFTDVDVDVVFERNGQTWRVPTFWSGGGNWKVRFAPPNPGEYSYRLESTDRANKDLNGHPGKIEITPYRGTSPLLRHGMLRVSANGRYFEHADGTAFYWLGDTWWTGLSGRLPFEGFQRMAQDRKDKGFTVIQLCAGLVPYEETPTDNPGFCNEGGCAWEPQFKRINPKFFDSADRRIQVLLDRGLVPAMVGAWGSTLAQMGPKMMKRHWRYLIARYGAYPVFWIAGGEVYDPPPAEDRGKLNYEGQPLDVRTPGWTEVVRYIRNTDPYRHPLSVHELPPPYDSAIQDESLTDFDFFQIGHEGWAGIGTEVAMADKHYARTRLTKPMVVGEIGYEGLGATHWQDFQRAGFWIGMLNGLAGYTYGGIGTFETYSATEPPQNIKYSFDTWQESMNLPGSYQVGLGARLLRRYPWWEFQPHPEWVTPHGTTLLEPNDRVSGFDIDLWAARQQDPLPPDDALPLGEWNRAQSTWRLPYAAGIPRQVRLIYLPYFGNKDRSGPIVHGLEPGVRYHAYYWEPATGIQFDLGVVEAGDDKTPGRVDTTHLERQLYDDRGAYRGSLRGRGWSIYGGQISGPGWSEYGRHQHVDRDNYQAENPPSIGDWVLVLEARQ